MSKQLVRLFACASLISACAHSGSKREPSNLPTTASAAAANDGGLSGIFRNAAVADVILLSEANANGERTPLCHRSAKSDRDQIPHFLQTDPNATAPGLNLRECDADEGRRIKDVAATASRPEVAGVPVVAALCAIDFALTAGLTMALNNDRNKAGKRPLDAGSEYGAKLGVSAGVVASYAGKATTGLRRTNPSTFAQMERVALRASALTVVCAGAGYAVGYWMVPLK